MSENKKQSFELPRVQLYFLFVTSLAAIYPMIYYGKVVGSVTFIGIIVFYLFTEFRTIARNQHDKGKELVIVCFLMLLSGVLISYVGWGFIFLSILCLFKSYKYVQPL